MTLISLTVFLCWWMNPRDNLIKVEIVVENIIPMIWFDRNMMETIFHSAMSALPFLYKIWFEKKKFLHQSKSRLKLSKLMSMCVYHFRNVIQYLGTSRNVNFFSYQTSLCIFPSCLSLFSFLCLNLKRDHDVLI